MGVEILPKNGNYINGGLVYGQNTVDAQGVKQEMAQKGHSVEAPNAIGGKLSFGKDVIRVDLGSPKVQLAITPEIALGFTHQSSEVKVGEKSTWTVELVERNPDRRWDDERKEYVYEQPDREYYRFNNKEEAETFARTHQQNYWGNYNAGYPRETKQDVVDAASRIRGTIAPGLAVGVLMNFDDNMYARVDGFIRQNIIHQQETTAGARVSAGGMFGVYGEVEKRIAGVGTGDIRGSVGLQVRL